MKNKNFVFFLLLAVGMATRFPLSERYMSHTDASSLTLALSQYNLLQETPAPPGYPLYFAIGTVINFFFRNPHLSLAFESALFSGIGAIAFYIFGNSLGGKKTGFVAAALFLTAPSFFFFGITVYPYIVVIALYVFFVYASHRIAIKKKNDYWLLGLTYSLLIGIRPQELITTLPLFILAAYYLKNEARLKAVLVFCFVTLLWVIPFLTVVGGVQKYFEISSKAATDAIPLPSLTRFLTKKFELLSGLYLTLTVGPFFLVIYLVRKLVSISSIKTKRFPVAHVTFICVWVLPILMFNLFIRTEHVGYQSGYLIFLLVAISYAMPRLFRKNIFLVIAVTMVAAVNLFVFFQDRDPGYKKAYRQSSFHYSDLRRNDYELSNKISYINKNFSPQKTIIIAGPFFWRHARYYLPEYLLYEIDALSYDTDDSNTRRDAKNLHFTSYQSNDRFFVVSPGISAIVLFDDDMDKWVTSSKKVARFKGVAKLTVVAVKTGDKVKYGYHKLEVVGK